MKRKLFGIFIAFLAFTSIFSASSLAWVGSVQEFPIDEAYLGRTKFKINFTVNADNYFSANYIDPSYDSSTVCDCYLDIESDSTTDAGFAPTQIPLNNLGNYSTGDYYDCPAGTGHSDIKYGETLTEEIDVFVENFDYPMDKPSYSSSYQWHFFEGNTYKSEDEDGHIWYAHIYCDDPYRETTDEFTTQGAMLKKSNFTVYELNSRFYPFPKDGAGNVSVDADLSVSSSPTTSSPDDLIFDKIEIYDLTDGNNETVATFDGLANNESVNASLVDGSLEYNKTYEWTVVACSSNYDVCIPAGWNTWTFTTESESEDFSIGNLLSILPFIGFLLSEPTLTFLTLGSTTVLGLLVFYFGNDTLGLFTITIMLLIFTLAGWLSVWITLVGILLVGTIFGLK